MFVPNLIKSILPSRLLRNSTLPVAPISPSTPTTIPSTVYRERARQISGISNFSLGSNVPEQFVQDEEIKTWTLLLGRQEQISFMRRASSSGLILKTFARKNIPADLMFIWQEKKLKSQVSELNKMKCTYNLYKWRKLSDEKRLFLRKWQKNKREKLIKKFRKLTKNHKTWQKVITPKGSKFKRKLDKQRYRDSRTKKLIEAAKSKILNFSDFNISDTLYLILGKGFNFIPTPKPGKLRSREWNNALQHVRRNEWWDVFSEQENREFEKIPDKLKIPKSSRPGANYDLSEEAKAYTDTVLAGMRSYDDWAELKSQNLQKHEIKALKELESISGVSIMINQSDKDSKLVLVNMEDYKSMIEKAGSAMGEKSQVLIPTKKGLKIFSPTAIGASGGVALPYLLNIQIL